MRSKIIVILIFALPVCYVLSCNRNSKTIANNQQEFPQSLASLGLFKGRIDSLLPARGVEIYQLSSTLFTDYAEKQRLIKLPAGKKLRLNGDGLPQFPEGTILAKTFFYSRAKKGKNIARHILETRILRLKNGHWSAGTYHWNQAQDRALYDPVSTEVNVNWLDKSNTVHRVKYHIPSARECVSCHQSSEEIIPIGPKGMNLNREIQVGKKKVNQLSYMQARGKLILEKHIDKISRLPDYENKNIDLEHRARAYLEINCAHCHSSNGMAYRQSIMLGYKVPVEQSGINFNKNNIVDRMGNMGQFHMPKLGTTVLDKQGIDLIRKYITSLN
ncbi:hypothetical protein [Pedobacter cryoconitis]|uniref:Putative repeat protein (TIGR03806 family) n=1 Tax=Pedobacter cryoconitis TaxID=188932 RepID=A0A327SHF8_9SPHI|nr:hypothetical protein [Pedobacter cryoconitis]RAJ28138.1 putative repeat protein (TIGR03806 family) [Pedobacter cryoconitis]